MKDLGEAAYILGIKIYRDRSRHLIGLSQSTYLDKVLGSRVYRPEGGEWEIQKISYESFEPNPIKAAE